MSSNLPPGVTDAMIEEHVNGPMCKCGDYWSEHNEDGSCDCYKNLRTKEECPCKQFEEGHPEEPSEDIDD